MPAGRSACAWREAVPSTCGTTDRQRFMLTLHSVSSTPAPDLVELDRLEQRLEVAFAEALVALALDDLEEDRADDVLR